jgi:hypothetical protein
MPFAKTHVLQAPALALAATAALTRGTLSRFSFVASFGPIKTHLARDVANTGLPQVLKGTDTIGPSPSRVVGPGGIGSN